LTAEPQAAVTGLWLHSRAALAKGLMRFTTKRLRLAQHVTVSQAHALKASFMVDMSETLTETSFVSLTLAKAKTRSAGFPPQ